MQLKPGQTGASNKLIRAEGEKSREVQKITLQADYVVVGGGMAGTCSAITAAREGLKVVLMQDRPVLGGNASSEVRLWLLGATVHMGSNNRWAREGGVVGEIMVENFYRNPEGNPLIFDTVVLEKVLHEPNITLLLNTSMHEVEKVPGNEDRIRLVRGYCPQNETMYEIHAPLFCDATGVGTLGFLSGAAFRMGAESKEEFDEPFAPSGEFGGLLGDSIYFYTKKAVRPVKFVAPSYALKDIPSKIPRYTSFNATTDGCRLWWIEYGGRLDTVHESEKIKWELWRIVYGVWDYIKNSGDFPDAENLTLEWVGQVAGKREGRRFEGPYILRQSDVIDRKCPEDTVAYGGWSIDLHPADGVYAQTAGSHHLHMKGVYGIPYRCYYSRNVQNLFLAGRIISTTHVAFGTTRVMCTCAVGGQAVGVAAAMCKEKGLLPHDLTEKKLVGEMRRRLVLQGNYIPRYALRDSEDLAPKARLSASSSLELKTLPPDGPLLPLNKHARYQVLPLRAGTVPTFSLLVNVEKATTFEARLMTVKDRTHHTPDVELGKVQMHLKAGISQEVRLDFHATMPEDGLAAIVTLANDDVSIRRTTLRAAGLLYMNNAHQHDYSAVGGEVYPGLTPERRPGGQNIAFSVDKPIPAYDVQNLINGEQRPTEKPNCWIPSPEDPQPRVVLTWDKAQSIQRVVLCFDTDFDHAMESVLMGHPENVIPFCIQAFRLRQGVGGPVLHQTLDNHETIRTIVFEKIVTTDSLVLELLDPKSPVLKGIYEIRVYPQ